MRTALATLQQLASEAEALPAAVPERADIEVRSALPDSAAKGSRPCTHCIC
jgi:hypothetical protein